MRHQAQNALATAQCNCELPLHDVLGRAAESLVGICCTGRGLGGRSSYPDLMTLPQGERRRRDCRLKRSFLCLIHILCFSIVLDAPLSS